MPRQPPSSADAARPDGDRELSPRRCLVDGGLVEADGERAGWCLTARAYAVAYHVRVVTDEGHKLERARQTAAPFVCPHCRARLTWDGGCDRCFGSATPRDRETWTFPGDRYDLAMVPREDGTPGGTPEGHYERVALGPRPVASEAVALAALAEIQRMLAAMARRSAEVMAPVATDDPIPGHSEACDCARCVPAAP